MDQGQRTVLVGFHSGVEFQEEYLRSLGYDVTPVTTLEEMLTHMRDRSFDGYFMDLNLGHPDTTDVSPAEEVYKKVKDRVERGEAKFLGLSGNYRAVRKAEEKDIPCAEKGLALERIKEIFG